MGRASAPTLDEDDEADDVEDEEADDICRVRRLRLITCQRRREAAERRERGARTRERTREAHTVGMLCVTTLRMLYSVWSTLCYHEK